MLICHCIAVDRQLCVSPAGRIGATDASSIRNTKQLDIFPWYRERERVEVCVVVHRSGRDFVSRLPRRDRPLQTDEVSPLQETEKRKVSLDNKPTCSWCGNTRRESQASEALPVLTTRHGSSCRFCRGREKEKIDSYYRLRASFYISRGEWDDRAGIVAAS